MARQRVRNAFDFPIKQPIGKGNRPYVGVCANRGRSIQRSKDYTAKISERQDNGCTHMVTVATCQCGLLVFMNRRGQ